MPAMGREIALPSCGDEWGWGAAKDAARKVYDALRDVGGNFVTISTPATGYGQSSMSTSAKAQELNRW
jgi:hypothetical protein